VSFRRKKQILSGQAHNEKPSRKSETLPLSKFSARTDKKNNTCNALQPLQAYYLYPFGEMLIELVNLRGNETFHKTGFATVLTKS